MERGEEDHGAPLLDCVQRQPGLDCASGLDHVMSFLQATRLPKKEMTV